MLTVSSIDTLRPKCNTRRVYFSETGEYVTLPQQVLTLHDVVVGSTYEDLDKFDEIILEGQFKLAKERALRMLTRSDKTTFDIKKKLKEDGYNSAVCDEVIGFLEEYALCDDDAYARRFVQHSLESGIPPQKIIMKLRSKGLAKDQITELIEELQSVDNEDLLFKKGCRLIERFNVDDKKQRDKALRRLVSRGYSFDLSKKIINSQQDGS